MLGGVRVQVLGTGATPQGRLDRSPADLAVEAARAALADAGLRPDQVALVVFATGLAFVEDQAMIPGQSWLRALGVGSAAVLNVEEACASGLAALAVGRMAVVAGEGPVLVVAAEVMWRRRAAVAEGLLQGVAIEDRATYVAAAGDVPPLVAVNARWAAELLESGRADREQLVSVAAKAYAAGARNPIAQHRTGWSAAEVRESPMVAAPLTRLMCASYTDGAAAVVLGGGTGTEPAVRSVAMVGGDGTGGRERRLAQVMSSALADASVGPADVDVAELHDVTAAEELLALEAGGFYERGAAGAATARGETAVGGAGVTVNPSGGLLARGHPIGATGLLQVVEICDQLRGRSGPRQAEDARIGLTCNLGGFVGDDLAFAGAAVFERPRA